MVAEMGVAKTALRTPIQKLLSGQIAGDPKVVDRPRRRTPSDRSPEL
jgi:hypothetical protein